MLKDPHEGFHNLGIEQELVLTPITQSTTFSRKNRRFQGIHTDLELSVVSSGDGSSLGPDLNSSESPSQRQLPQEGIDRVVHRN